MPCTNELLRTPISARTATVTGMQRVGAAARRRPGPRDTAGAHHAGGRASPSEYWDYEKPNMAVRGPVSVIRTHFVPRAAFSAATTALVPDIVRNAAEVDNMCREAGCARDAAPGSGCASLARPQRHYLGTTV